MLLNLTSFSVFSFYVYAVYIWFGLQDTFIGKNCYVG